MIVDASAAEPPPDAARPHELENTEADQVTAHERKLGIVVGLLIGLPVGLACWAGVLYVVVELLLR